MRNAPLLLPLLAAAACVAAAPLRVAVLTDDLPGHDPALAARLLQAIEAAGHYPQSLNAMQLQTS